MWLEAGVRERNRGEAKDLKAPTAGLGWSGWRYMSITSVKRSEVAGAPGQAPLTTVFFRPFVSHLDKTQAPAECPIPGGSLVNKLLKEPKRGKINTVAIDSASAADYQRL